MSTARPRCHVLSKTGAHWSLIGQEVDDARVRVCQKVQQRLAAERGIYVASDSELLYQHLTVRGTVSVPIDIDQDVLIAIGETCRNVSFEAGVEHQPGAAVDPIIAGAAGGPVVAGASKKENGYRRSR